MSNVTRICVQCGHGNPMEARYCARCGYDTQADLPATQGNTLPALISRAAVPVLVGAASLAISAGWKLLQSLLAQPAAPQANQPIQVKKAEPPAVRPRRTIRIRTSWAVGDAGGNWRQGHSEHEIEFED